MNWVKQQNNNPQLSTPDKLNALIKIGYKLVLCQLHELERMKLLNKISTKGTEITFIEYLYTHYIVKQLPKTYLCNDMLIVLKPN